MAEENDVTVNKLAEENQVTIKGPKEPQRVTTKNPKKVEAGKRLAENNHKKREVKKMKSEAASGVNQYYGIGAVIAVGVIGGLGYCIYRTKTGQATTRQDASTSGEVNIPCNPTVSQ